MSRIQLSHYLLYDNLANQPLQLVLTNLVLFSSSGSIPLASCQTFTSSSSSFLHKHNSIVSSHLRDHFRQIFTTSLSICWSVREQCISSQVLYSRPLYFISSLSESNLWSSGLFNLLLGVQLTFSSFENGSFYFSNFAISCRYDFLHFSGSLRLSGSAMSASSSGMVTLGRGQAYPLENYKVGSNKFH